MKKNGEIFEFYESRCISDLGMFISVILAIFCSVQPGQIKEPLYISIAVLPFPMILFLFFYNISRKPFISIDSEKIVIQKKSFYFSDISTVFFYQKHNIRMPNQEILDIRLKGESFSRKHYFVLSFMPNTEMRLLEEEISKKVQTLHLPKQYYWDLPHLNIPSEMRKKFRREQ